MNFEFLSNKEAKKVVGKRHDSITYDFAFRSRVTYVTSAYALIAIKRERGPVLNRQHSSEYLTKKIIPKTFLRSQSQSANRSHFYERYIIKLRGR